MAICRLAIIWTHLGYFNDSYTRNSASMRYLTYKENRVDREYIICTIVHMLPTATILRMV